jgi:hypothetical protein
MRHEALIAAVLVASQVAASSAGAEPRDNAASPQFSAAETRTVGRSETLLLRVRDEKTATPHRQSSNRSAKGSVELLEALKKAQKEKGGGK